VRQEITGLTNTMLNSLFLIHSYSENLVFNGIKRGTLAAQRANGRPIWFICFKYVGHDFRPGDGFSYGGWLFVICANGG
jgi:hypothetical protein